MHNSMQIRLRTVCVVTAAIFVGILIHGSAMAQVPARSLIEPEREVPAKESSGEGTHVALRKLDPALEKAWFGLFHITSSPSDIPGSMLRRISGNKPAHSGSAIVFSPLEGVAQGLTRGVAGTYYLVSSPFPPHPTKPPYQYDFGLSPIDGALEGCAQGTENVVLSPFELPVTMHHAARDRGLVYGSAYGLVMGPTRMAIRAGAGAFEMLTNGGAMLHGMLLSWSPDFQAIDFEPVYDVGLSEDLPEMFRERPRLKRPVHVLPGQTRR